MREATEDAGMLGMFSVLFGGNHVVPYTLD